MKKQINFTATDAVFKKTINQILPYDLTLHYDEYSLDEKKRIIKFLNVERLPQIFIHFDSEEQFEFFHLLEDVKKKILLRTLETDDLKDFIEELDETEQLSVYPFMTQAKKRTIERLLTYGEDIAASLMSTDFFTVSANLSIKDATHKVISQSSDQDYIDTVYVVDDNNHPIGMIPIKDLIIARSHDKLTDIMSTQFYALKESDTIDKAIQMIKDYDLDAIPVVSDEYLIVGIVTADDIFDEMVDDLEDDFQKMAMIVDHEPSLTSLERSKQRLPWLLIAVILNLLIASFLSIFERTLSEVIALVLFQPLILDMAGNIGTQSLAVTIIGLHKDDYEQKETQKKHVFKELRVGFINSLILAVSSCLFAFVFLSIIPVGNQKPLEIGFVVFTAMFSSMFISSLMGVLIPLGFDKMKVDPAAASGPIMTTVNDIVALVIYFGVATMLFI
ncbi:MAG: magnesium transporter [Acholeplasmataceae bacterium]|nr:magnesium transporter [Acholeplasmataceae bacterium]